jgi:hypothetical protein
VVSRAADGSEVTLIQTIKQLGLEVADFTVDALDVRVRSRLITLWWERCHQARLFG